MRISHPQLVPLALGNPRPLNPADNEGDAQGVTPSTTDVTATGPLASRLEEITLPNIWRAPHQESAFTPEIVYRLGNFIWRPETGLPYIGYSVPSYNSENEAELEQVAERFLNENEPALTGLVEEEAFAARVRIVNWPIDDIYHFHFGQLSAKGIPVYGAYISLNFVKRNLNAFVNRFYPMTTAATAELTWPEPRWLLEPALLKNLPFGVKGFLTPPHLHQDQRSSIDGPAFADRWILPIGRVTEQVDPKEINGWWILPGIHDGQTYGDGGLYRPIWRVALEDTDRGASWIALVDAETYQVLVLHATTDTNTVSHLVYTNNGDVQTHTLKKRDLDLGQGNTLATAERIRFDVTAPRNRFVELQVVNPTPDAILSATTFYQLYNAQSKVADLFKTMGLTASVSATSGPEYHPLDEINVVLTTDFISGAAYDYTKNTLSIGKSGSVGTHTIEEAGLDREVLIHEFVHAALHYLSPAFFTFATVTIAQGDAQWRYTNAVNEGVAYFVACDNTDDGHWAEGAYGNWATIFDFTQPPIAPDVLQTPDLNDDPHHFGVWWARLFWSIRTQHQERAQRLLWQTLDLDPGPVDSLKAFAHLLYAQAEPNHALQNSLNAIFNAYGISFP